MDGTDEPPTLDPPCTPAGNPKEPEMNPLIDCTELLGMTVLTMTLITHLGLLGGILLRRSGERPLCLFTLEGARPRALVH